jgi:L-rhamnose-H+ transport protein
MLIGIAVVSVAGSIRERAEAKEMGLNHSGGKPLMAGLLVAIAAGILSSLLSDAIAFTSHMVDTATRLGASPVWAPNVVLAPTTTGGSIANFVYCAVMMKRKRSAGLFWQSSATSHWIYGIAMGAFWYGGLVMYGMGEQRVGSVDGWPLFIGAMILSSSAAGFLTGEWRSVGLRGRLVLCGGSFLIFLALIVVGMAHHG